MNRIEKTVPDSYLKIVPYMSELFTGLNLVPQPYYGNETVDIISITPIGTDKDGNPLFCYELRDIEEE